MIPAAVARAVRAIPRASTLPGHTRNVSGQQPYTRLTHTAPGSASRSAPACDEALALSSGSEKTSPGPTWLWTAPLDSYTRLHSRRPYTVQLISSLIIYLMGDLTAQTLAPTPEEEECNGEGEGEGEGKVEEKRKLGTHDPQRTMRALIIGGTASLPSYHWFLFLSRNFNYFSKPLNIGLKVVINQIVFTPIFNTYFFGMQTLLAGARWEDIVQRVKHTVPRSWVNSWKLWPAVTAFSFAIVRVELRGLFAGVVAIGWQTYLCILNQRAARLERSLGTPKRGGEDKAIAQDG